MGITGASQSSGGRRPPRLVAAALLLAGAAGLSAYTTCRAVRRESVEPPVPALTALTDATEATNRRREFAGIFATGEKPGDRTLTILAEGRVDYAELGAKAPVTIDSDTYGLRRRGRHFSLVTGRGGVIDTVNLDTLVYWGDTYRRR